MIEDAPAPPSFPYRHVAWCYDALASAYSLGAIDRAKRHHHALIRPGDRVLYAGAGRGREIVGALERGAAVTCVEPCPAMARRLRQRLAPYGERVSIYPRSIEQIHAQPVHDLAAAHFFLNLFGPARMPAVLEHLRQFIRPGGRLIVADFRPADAYAGPIDRLLRQLHYGPVLLAGVGLRICAAHPIYDYEPAMISAGLTIESRAGFSAVPGLPPWYEVIVARRHD